jgi:hypothetical protein
MAQTEMANKLDKSNKDQVIFVRAEAELVDRLGKAARLQDRPVSQFVRETLTKKLNQMAQRHPELKAA